MIGAALLFALTLTFEPSPGCRLEQAAISFVPPSIMRVMVIEQCGSIVCWQRRLAIEGHAGRVGESRVCEKATSPDGSPLVPAPKNSGS